MSKAEGTRNAFIAVAITASIVLVVGCVGIFLFIWKRRQVVAEPEAGADRADHKSSWWMVDGKTETKDWWRLGRNTQVSPPAEPLEPEGRSRTQRLKAALRLRVPDQRGTTMSPPLPMQSDPNLQPGYPERLERGGTQDPAPSLPEIPSIAVHLDDQHLESKPRVPVRAVLTHNSSRSISE